MITNRTLSTLSITAKLSPSGDTVYTDECDPFQKVVGSIPWLKDEIISMPPLTFLLWYKLWDFDYFEELSIVICDSAWFILG
jgi:hypothetical protein